VQPGPTTSHGTINNDVDDSTSVTIAGAQVDYCVFIVDITK